MEIDHFAVADNCVFGIKIHLGMKSGHNVIIQRNRVCTALCINNAQSHCEHSGIAISMKRIYCRVQR
ncbi:hypothetical protein SDC9_67045 [bioreactor metagenome]|uniref:Uncharacterized protein n=1 Tax=bioreactor metagenome TaxID=1076179 RepID=A0A644Y393_9ZZZZ